MATRDTGTLPNTRPITYSVGAAVAITEGHINIPHMLLGLIAVTLSHISINVINEYFDHKSGLDYRTNPTPFSGGSGVLTQGELEPETVYRFALTTMTIALASMLYLAHRTTWMLIPIAASAGITIYYYTPFFSKIYLGELVTGINFGPLVALGGYMSITGKIGYTSIAAGIVPGILVGTLLYLNEFPDLDADKSVGRRNAVIFLGLKRASIGYGVLIASVYLWVAASVLHGWLPATTLITFFTLPIAYKAVNGVTRNEGRVPDILPYMGENVKLTLTITALTSVGVLLSLLI